MLSRHPPNTIEIYFVLDVLNTVFRTLLKRILYLIFFRPLFRLCGINAFKIENNLISTQRVTLLTKLTNVSISS